MLTGIGIGITAFVMENIEHFLVHENIHLMQIILKKQSLTDPLEQLQWIWQPYLQFTFICAFCGFLAAALTTYYGPGAAGSGVAELIGYMNGVNYPNFIAFETLITKILGTVAAVAGKLAIGKEGPLAHIGAIWGVIIAHLPGF